MRLYLVKRGPKPEYHRAPFHPVIVCAQKGVAEWECGWTGEGGWMWEQFDGPHSGWLLRRWAGLVIDYGHVVRGGALPDGTGMGFHHPHGRPETWALLAGAVWWSTKPLPKWLAEKGVIAAPDDFTRESIRGDEEFMRQLRGEA